MRAPGVRIAAALAEITGDADQGVDERGGNARRDEPGEIRKRAFRAEETFRTRNHGLV
jgi:hypothetical protein